MELPQRIALSQRRLPQLQPDTLTHLIAGRLTGPAQVADELEPDSAFGAFQVLHQKLVPQFGGPHGSRFNTQTRCPLIGYRQFTVHTDIEHHASCAHPLGVQHPHPVPGVL